MLDNGLDSPAHHPRERCVRAGYTEESPEVLYTDACVRDVDGEANQAHRQPCQDEWRAHLDAIGPYCEGQQDDGCSQSQSIMAMEGSVI